MSQLIPDTSPEFLPLDTVRQVATPEGCDIALPVAGLVVRARAWFLDMIFRGVLVFGVNIFLIFGKVGWAISIVCVFLIMWFYPILFEVYMQGQTPGKRICKLRVLYDDGRPVGWNAAFVRNTLRFVDFLPLLYFFGTMTVLLNRDARRLGDLAAGTVVVHCIPQKKDWARMHGSQGSEPPPFVLTLPEQRAIIEFAYRHQTLSPERAEELASLAEPLTAHAAPGTRQQTVLRLANYLLGK